MSQSEFETILETEYEARQELRRLFWQAAGAGDDLESAGVLQAMIQAETSLSDLAARRAALQTQTLETRALVSPLSVSKSGLVIEVFLRMAQLPSGVAHLLDAGRTPLITCWLTNNRNIGPPLRVRVTSYIEEYSAHAIATLAVPSGKRIDVPQLPLLFPEKVRQLSTLTYAALHILVEDLDNGEIHQHFSQPVRLLAYNTAPLATLDPMTGAWLPMEKNLAAYVTPNIPPVMGFLRQAAERHKTGKLTGYQGRSEQVEASVASQVQAIYETLGELKIMHIYAAQAFNPEEGLDCQSIRPPGELLESGMTTALESTLLFASLLEAASLNPAICLAAGNAFLGWETGKKNERWRYLDTRQLSSASFEQACRSGERLAQIAAQLKGFRRLSIRELRAVDKIVPVA
jgi:hypothetical protein